MNNRKFYTVLVITVLVTFVFISLCGCITKKESASLEDMNVSNNSTLGFIPEISWINNVTNSENLEIDETPFNISLKKTAVLELDNGYSLKVLDINRQEEQIQVSLRKDGNEYDARTMLSGSTYNVKDTTDLNTIYIIRVDRILDNSFFVELTCQKKPEIMLEAGIYEGKITKSELRITDDTITRTYKWEYDDTDFSVKYEYNIESYDMYSERSRNRDYANYVNDPFDDELISQITIQMGQLADEAGYSESEIPYIAMAFVQSLPYVSDSASSGYDEYPRFPFETLYHGGGDCEDSSFLLAAILNNMGYGVALIELPGHMAVGVKGDSKLEGSYYSYSDTRYYYFETTNSGWDVGVIPDEYANAEATVVPIMGRYPELRIIFSGTGQINKYATYVDIDIEIENVGSSIANDVVIYATLETTTDNLIWDELKTDTNLNLDVEETISYTVTNLHVPAGEKYRVGIWAWGSNANTEYVYSDWTTS
ncbi:hypothetical protein [Methanolobus sp.]|jgi:hypothetical protein|uniref:hypothetical protein n=1 Tax=Methanolobus sp. TaxID=1874737 RepID=UPI0025EF7382|nr:hypothetical protein [Methanolobus sp.]